MQEIGVVHKVSKSGFAVVRFDRKMACENCNMCFKPKEENYVELKVRNTLKANVGDSVKITMDDRAVLTASFWVYVVPLIVVAIVIACTYWIKNEWIIIGSSMGALVLSFVGLTFVDKYYRKKKGYFPVMSAILIGNAVEKYNSDQEKLEKEIDNHDIDKRKL